MLGSEPLALSGRVEVGGGGGYALSQRGLALLLCSGWLPVYDASTASRPARVVRLNATDMQLVLQARITGRNGGRVNCSLPAGAGGLHDRAAAAVLCSWSDGGCAVVLDRSRSTASHAGLPQLVALSCWKSEGCWLQVRQLDKGTLRTVQQALTES